MFAVFIVFSAIASLVYSQSSTVMPSSSTSPIRTKAWEDLVVKPVQIIAELSRVCIVMSRQDYTLDTSGRYTYIMYPSSYRATLTQAINIVDSTFKTAETSMSRVGLIVDQVSDDLRTALKILLEMPIQERQIWLPGTLNTIADRADDVTSAVEKVLEGLEKVTGFFDELLRAVYPSSSTSTQSTKSPLDINHATAISNIIAYLKSLTTIWYQMAQESRWLANVATQTMQFIDDGHRILWHVSNMDQTKDLLFRLASYYNMATTKIITKHTSNMNRFLTLESEETRLSLAQEVNTLADTNIPTVQRGFARVTIDHEMHNKQRNEEYQQYAATLST